MDYANEIEQLWQQIESIKALITETETEQYRCELKQAREINELEMRVHNLETTIRRLDK